MCAFSIFAQKGIGLVNNKLFSTEPDASVLGSAIRESVDSHVGMALTRPLSLNKHNGSELSNAALLSLFRHTACSTGVSIHSKTLKVGKIHRYNSTWKFLNRRFLHLLLLQTVYPKLTNAFTFILA